MTSTSLSAHTHEQSAEHAFTTFVICGVFAFPLIWIVQNFLQIRLCLAVLSVAIHFCRALRTLTTSNFNMFRIDWPTLRLCHLYLLFTAPHCDYVTSIYYLLPHIATMSPLFTRSVPVLRSLHWLPVTFIIVFKIGLLTYKTLRERHPVYLHSMLPPTLPSHIPSRSLRKNEGISLSVPSVSIRAGVRGVHSWAPFLWNNLPLSAHSGTSFATFRNHLKTHLFDLTFPPQTPGHLMADSCY